MLSLMVARTRMCGYFWPKSRQQGWEEMFAGDRTGGQEQFAADRGFVAGDFPTGLTVKVENPLGVVVELLARLGEQNTTALPLEQGLAERLFEGLNTLADAMPGSTAAPSPPR